MTLKWNDFPDHWVADGKYEGAPGTYRTRDLSNGKAMLEFFLEGRALKPPKKIGSYDTHETAMAVAEKLSEATK